MILIVLIDYLIGYDFCNPSIRNSRVQRIKLTIKCAIVCRFVYNPYRSIFTRGANACKV